MFRPYPNSDRAALAPLTTALYDLATGHATTFPADATSQDLIEAAALVIGDLLSQRARGTALAEPTPDPHAICLRYISRLETEIAELRRILTHPEHTFLP